MPTLSQLFRKELSPVHPYSELLTIRRPTYALFERFQNSGKQTLQLFQDYEEHRDQTTQEPCKDKWIWYITNGHLQCSGMCFIFSIMPKIPLQFATCKGQIMKCWLKECICYPELAAPFGETILPKFDNVENLLTRLDSDTKLRQFLKWIVSKISSRSPAARPCKALAQTIDLN